MNSLTGTLIILQKCEEEKKEKKGNLIPNLHRMDAKVTFNQTVFRRQLLSGFGGGETLDHRRGGESNVPEIPQENKETKHKKSKKKKEEKQEKEGSKEKLKKPKTSQGPVHIGSSMIIL